MADRRQEKDESAERKPHPYEDILHLPHPEPRTKRRMPPQNRAAQFAPFAALTGFSEILDEASRFLDVQKELDEAVKAGIADRLHEMTSLRKHKTRCRITYFVPDEKKRGGHYRTEWVVVREIDEARRLLRLADGTEFSVDRLNDVEWE
ncbi:MAG: hypothetical protein SOR89_04030 [Ndongobacter sp.]|nr:hypothetical protein [Ndongobacter sp.]